MNILSSPWFVKSRMLLFFLYLPIVAGTARTPFCGGEFLDAWNQPTADFPGIEDLNGNGVVDMVEILGELHRCRQESRLAIVADLPLGNSFTAPQSPYDLNGLVINLDGENLPSEIRWSIQRDNQIAQGYLPVDGSGTWSGQFPLFEGVNKLSLTIPWTISEEEISITYNQNFSFAGAVVLTPDVVYQEEQRTLTANVALTHSDTDPDNVHLVHLVGETREIVGTFADDGNLANGDEIEGDGIYSARVEFTSTEVGFEHFLVEVGRLSGPGIAESELVSILSSVRLTEENFEELLNKQNSYQEQLEAVTRSNGDVEELVQQILVQLQNDPDVAEVGVNEGGLGLWVVYQDGVPGVLYASAPGIKGGPAMASKTGNERGSGVNPGPVLFDEPGRWNGRTVPYLPYDFAVPRITGTRGTNPDPVTSNKALVIAAQYFDWGENDDIPAMEQLLVDNGCFDVNYIRYNSSGSGSVEDFKSLGDYGVVLVSSHGDSFYNGLFSLWNDIFGWNGPFGQVILHSNMASSQANRLLYEDDLKKGRLVLWGGNFGITPSFIKHYSGTFPNSLIYMSICRGTWNGTLAQSFLSRGAGSFLGYSDYVAVSFCQTVGPTFLERMLIPGNTMADAFIPGQSNNGAEFILFGSNDLSLEANTLNDLGFESGQIGQGWTIDGDARIIPVLGGDGPTEGNLMAIISTGLGFTVTSGSLSQEFCFNNSSRAPSTISFDWNMYSEEWLEYVGSQFQDAFTAVLSEVGNPGNSVTLVSETIDSLATQVHAVSIGFDQGDVYATGWRTSTTNIPASLQDVSLRLEFFATDVGDSIFDSAVLLDNIQITAEQPTKMTAYAQDKNQ